MLIYHLIWIRTGSGDFSDHLIWIRAGSGDCSDHLGWIRTGSDGYGDLRIRKKKTNISVDCQSSYNVTST